MCSTSRSPFPFYTFTTLCISTHILSRSFISSFSSPSKTSSSALASSYTAKPYLYTVFFLKLSHTLPQSFTFSFPSSLLGVFISSVHILIMFSIIYTFFLFTSIYVSLTFISSPTTLSLISPTYTCRMFFYFSSTTLFAISIPSSRPFTAFMFFTLSITCAKLSHLLCSHLLQSKT